MLLRISLPGRRLGVGGLCGGLRMLTQTVWHRFLLNSDVVLLRADYRSRESPAEECFKHIMVFSDFFFTIIQSRVLRDNGTTIESLVEGCLKHIICFADFFFIVVSLVSQPF